MTPDMPTVAAAPVVASLNPLGYYRFARDFFDAGRSCRGRNDSLVRHFLYAQAVELGLKAFLLSAGESSRTLRTKKYGHSLTNLLTYARQRGLDAHVTFSVEEQETL